MVINILDISDLTLFWMYISSGVHLWQRFIKVLPNNKTSHRFLKLFKEKISKTLNPAIILNSVSKIKFKRIHFWETVKFLHPRLNYFLFKCCVVKWPRISKLGTATSKLLKQQSSLIMLFYFIYFSKRKLRSNVV